jgi:hypothetical protein
MFGTKVIGVDDFEFYKNSQLKIRCILDYTKNDKSDNVSCFENVHYSLHAYPHIFLFAMPKIRWILDWFLCTRKFNYY